MSSALGISAAGAAAASTASAGAGAASTAATLAGVGATTASTVGAALPAVGAGISSGLGLGAGFAAGGSSLLWVQAGLGLLSAATSLIGAELQARAQKARSLWDDFAARNEVLRGQQDANNLRERYLEQMAHARARYAAGGIDITTGTPVTMEDQIQEVADRETSIARYNGMVAGGARSATAEARRAGAVAARIGGLASATRPLASMYASNRRLYG